MRLFNFFKLLNKETKGSFATSSIIILLFIVNIVITVHDYGLLANNPDKPYAVFLLLSSIIHFGALLLVWGIGALIYYWFLPFITDTVMPLWEESATEPKPSIQSGGKVKFE
ncbi:MAG: hypothetical protein DRH57_08585 [Candidatus Cloacimonadota bacterium]|nr:MAG: hypothetical protein DRH57_08585 [Candidatus Cloacimonadota bacterium]